MKQIQYNSDEIADLKQRLQDCENTIENVEWYLRNDEDDYYSDNSNQNDCNRRKTCLGM